MAVTMSNGFSSIPSSPPATRKSRETNDDSTRPPLLFRGHCSLTNKIRSCSSIDSALGDLSYSSSSSSSTSSKSRKQDSKTRQLSNYLPPSPFFTTYSDIDVLVVSHGAIIRELIKYFSNDLNCDIGEHLSTIQDIAPNTSVTRFEIQYESNNVSINEKENLQFSLITYHNKTHLLLDNNDCLDVTNKCNL